jgi:hypothetical protein
MATGGCGLKTGKPTTTESTFAKSSRVAGPNTRLLASGRATPLAATTPISTKTRSKRRKTKTRPQQLSTPATNGLTTPSSDCQLQNGHRSLSVSCRKTQTFQRDQSSLSTT